LGCGAGCDLFLISSKISDTGHVTGIDISKEMVKASK